LIARFATLTKICFCVIFALPCFGFAQTYTVSPAGTAKPATRPGTPPVTAQSLGWGSNIQNARLARAAQQALQRGDHAAALSYAQRAAASAPNDPQLWFLLGYAARLAGRYSQSIAAYQHGLKLQPGSVDGLSGLAQTYSVTGRTDEAIKLLTQVLTADPRRRSDAQLLGDIYLRTGDTKNAILWLSRAERMQQDPRAELLLALAYQRENQLDTARRYLNMAKQHAPDNPEVQRALAGYYRETGDYSAAIAALRSIPNPHPDVVAELAYTYQLAGDVKHAASVYRQAANAMPHDLELQLSAAQAQVAAGSIRDAEPFLQRAAALDPSYYRLHAIRGQIAVLEERDQDAAQEYQTALANLPAAPSEGPLYGIQLHMDLLSVYKSLGDDEAAARQLSIAEQQIAGIHEQGAGRAGFLRLRALIKMNAGQTESALADIRQAVALSPNDPANLQLDGDLLMKLGRTQEAMAQYQKILHMDPRNRFALVSLGYAQRAAGDNRAAAKTFLALARVDPSLYVPYLALGDLYTAERQYSRAEMYYRKAYARSPHNALVTAGAMNAAIEAHNIPLAGTWLKRANGRMRQDPLMLRETERYYAFKGDPAASAAAGEAAIQKLPMDRDVVVYLGYDLLRLGHYHQLLQLTDKYKDLLPHEPDIPLLAGYVQKHDGNLQQAAADFSEAIARDPNVATAYVNRGFIMNDLHQPEKAAADFEMALKLDPKDAEAHLGLAYADLDLNRPESAIEQTRYVEQEAGASAMLHSIRATAYGREGMLTRSVQEYHAALRMTPNDGALHLGLGETLFAARRYHQAVAELHTAEQELPGNPDVSALLARSYAHIGDRQETLHYVNLAEQQAAQQPASPQAAKLQGAILVGTGEALSTIGEQRQAMQRFEKALALPGSDRVGVRLAIARQMADQDRSADAQRQIALAMMEAEAGDTAAPTGDQYIAAADIFRQLHEYKLSQVYLEHARAAGASDVSVRVGMASTYLALGDTLRAQAELAAVGRMAPGEASYQYQLAQAAVYQQEHHGAEALVAYAQATTDAGEDQTAEQSLITTGANEGYLVNPTVSLLGNASVQALYEDSTVYVLDSKLDASFPVNPNNPSLLPPPRSSLLSQGTAAYHLHLNHLPPAGGYYQVVDTRGTISVPATNSIVNRNTIDNSFNFGLSPTLHLGHSVVTFDSGVQGTIRRDTLSPVEMNQNLFRAFTYMSTSSLFNAVSASGYFIWEAGPFTESNIHSTALTSALDFRVGTPWGKTALLTGWGMNDQQFSPVGIEDYYTTTYIGLSHQFSPRFSAAGLVEDLRTWRVVQPNSGVAQALRPAGTIDFTPNAHWGVRFSTAYFSTRSFHVYDATQNSLSVSYERAYRHRFTDAGKPVNLQYPIRISAGFQQQDFFNFPVGPTETFRPYISITIF
jgi:tetratricopeptide (TPR) repeat protein